MAVPREWDPIGSPVRISAHNGCLVFVQVARVLPPPSSVCFLHSSCRQNHSKASHGVVETWSGSAAPPHAPSAKLGAAEQGKSLPSVSADPKEEGLEAQISRLAELIGRLESKTVWFDLQQRLSDEEGTNMHLQLVRQEMAVCPEQLSEFVDSLRQYLRGTAGAGSCFQ